MNKVILIGRLVRDVELKTISTTGNAVVNNAIATSRRRTSAAGERIDETLFIDVVFYGRTAEIVGQYLHKGSKICVEGYLQQQTWVDSQTNQNRQRIQIVCENMEMLDSKNDNQQFANPQNNYQNNYQNNQQNSYSNNYQNNFGAKNSNFQQNSQSQFSTMNNYNAADDAEIPF